MPLLIKLLDDGDLNEDSAKALGDFGPLAKAAVPKLQQLARQSGGDPGIRTLATRALRQIDPQAAADPAVK